MRQGFYKLPSDRIRRAGEIILLFSLALSLYLQAWQYRVTLWQYGSPAVFFKHLWNLFEILR